MAGLTRDQRAKAWNIKFFVGDSAFAGIYQDKDCLTIADVARDLDLCLVFKRPAGEQAVLLPRHMNSADLADLADHIQLDCTNTDSFPAAAVTAHYTYLFHSHNRCSVSSGQSHTPDSDCYRQPPLPSRRHDVRYVAIGKQPERAGKAFMAPLRNTRATKRSASGSRKPSPSSTQSEVENEEIPMAVISPETARANITTFRSNVLTSGNTTCAISGKGRSRLDGLIGTGIEAAHIIPQIHWAVYPLGNLDLTTIEEKAQLEIAWRRTCMSVLRTDARSTLHSNMIAQAVEWTALAQPPTPMLRSATCCNPSSDKQNSRIR